MIANDSYILHISRASLLRRFCCAHDVNTHTVPVILFDIER
jgi:hypothetical protein